MTTHLVQVTLPAASGVEKDNVVNSFCVNTNDAWVPETELGEVTIPIMGFYNFVGGNGAAVGHYISRGIARTAGGVRMDVYDISGDLAGTPHGSPIATDFGTLVAAGHAVPDYPSEVACCLTLRAINWQDQQIERPDGADQGAEVDRPRQRYTGRIYVGPLEAAAGTTGSDGRVRPHADLQTALLNSAEQLYDQLAANGHFWAVWSRKDAVARGLTEVQVDDAFDVQRRRGLDPTVRATRFLL